MQFFFVKSNIPHKWLKNLCRYYLNMFAPENSLLWRSIPAASHLTLPATRSSQQPDPASYPTLPTLPTLPACPPCLPACPCQPRRRRKRCEAFVLPLFACEGCMCGVPVNVQLTSMIHADYLILYVTPTIFYVPYLIFYLTPPIFYVQLLLQYLIFYLSSKYSI